MLFRFILAIYTCFLSLLQYGYPHTISIKSIDIPDELIYHLDINTRVIKDDSQKFTGTCSLGHSYLCKDNVCVCIEEIYNKPFIEFPDKDNYIHKYILIPFAPFYKNVISQYIKSNKNETIHVSTDSISVRCVFSAQDVGKYFVLDNLPNEAYLFSTKDCTKTYICKSRDKGFFSDDVYDCYYRTEIVNGSFGPTSRVDPDQCMFKGNVKVKAPCYYTSNGNEKTIDNINIYTIVPFHDIDNNRALTEFGWCEFTNKNEDATWMSKINPDTHDSGTYALKYDNLPFMEDWAITQNLDIYEQLIHGIR
ncbi:hypothetical protein LY90DRAFT_632213 [Neocallimastix californiae]|uniref:Uncharacterized protein n=1 Tax=Neocallimastix californiae TaxID=1754190 RepID=A0A1Y2AHZ5_9FUNG|nr:hypothetical protein LY90DRAFT_632213 [Neocallimastix californiae]|eukprot:ORY22092.1 hypothetical protein LY90DRAFT_632213 [Neocallimastix californiae]